MPGSREVVSRFFESLEYYSATLNEMHTAAYGDVVVAWGFFTEDFKHHGCEPEIYQIRFSSTWIEGDDGELLKILNHRDIQTFESEGRYIPVHR